MLEMWAELIRACWLAIEQVSEREQASKLSK